MKKGILNELAANIKRNGAALTEKMKAYDMAKIGYELQEQESDDIYNKVLAEHDFFASRSCDGIKIKEGAKITDVKHLYLLCDNDFDKVQDLAHDILVAEGITDENGYFIEPWVEIMLKARRELIDFAIENILPAALRDVFRKHNWDVVKMDKLINILREIA